MHVCTYTHLYKHIYGGIPHPAFLRRQIVVVRTRGDGTMALIFTRQVTCQVKEINRMAIILLLQLYFCIRLW